MNYATLILTGLFPMLLLSADTLEVRLAPGSKAPYTGKQPLEFTLKLDQAADAAKLLYLTPKKYYFQINGSSALPLVPSPDKRTFTGRLPEIRTFFNWIIYAAWNNTPDKMQFVPVITRQGKEIRLKSASLPCKFRLDHDLMLQGNLPLGTGKFDTGLHFDGKTALAGMKRFRFDPQKGSIDLWIFMPLVLQPKMGTVFFIQSENGTFWSYHQLSIPAKSRRLEYLTYRHKEKKSCRIRSGEIESEDFIFVQCTWDAAANKMELFINGKSAGTSSYMPAGSELSSLTIGGRIHNSAQGPQAITLNQMVLDEFHVTSNPQKLPVPDKPHVKTAEASVLFHFDAGDLTRNICR